MKQVWPPGVNKSDDNGSTQIESCGTWPGGGNSSSMASDMASRQWRLGTVAGDAAVAGATSDLEGHGRWPVLLAPPVMQPSTSLPAGAPVPAPLFNGLRVRMGISSGVLPPDMQAEGSDIMHRAKEVSDAGAGRQVDEGAGRGG